MKHSISESKIAERRIFGPKHKSMFGFKIQKYLKVY